MMSSFFISWNHKHSHEQLSSRLTESILRHENDFAQEGRRKQKIESIEGLVTLHIKEMEVALGKKMAQIALEHTEQLTELQQSQQVMQQQLNTLIETLNAGASAPGSAPHSRANSPDPTSSPEIGRPPAPSRSSVGVWYVDKAPVPRSRLQRLRVRDSSSELDAFEA